MLAGSGGDSGDVWGERTGCALQLAVLGGTRPWLELRSGPKAGAKSPKLESWT